MEHSFLDSGWSRILPEVLTVTQPAKKSPALYVNRSIITVFRRARHWSLYWARWIKSTSSLPVYL